MIPLVHLSLQKICEAKRFVEILSHPDFIFFPPKPKTIKEEVEFLRQAREKRKAGLEYNFSIYADDNLVGGAGIKIDYHRNYIGEIGYFVDRDYWGRGIATQAVALMEGFIAAHLPLVRAEIVTLPENGASIRVAEKSGYIYEATLRGKIQFDSNYKDAVLFSKVLLPQTHEQQNR